MEHQFQNILSKLYDDCWLITEQQLELIMSIVDRKISGQELTSDQLAAIEKKRNAKKELELPDRPSVAILPVQGPMFPKANLITEVSGATSTQQLMNNFKTLMENDNVTSIILDIDSPGGNADMIKELADTVYSYRGKKPIIAVANTLAASGSYYVASQADEFYLTPSGRVGSIGVVSVHTETSKADAEKGIKHTILSIGEHKADGNPHEPLSDSAKESRLESMREIYDEFVSDVARGRNTSIEDVINNFGKGKVYRAKAALERGMVDGVETFDSVLHRMSSDTPVVKRPLRSKTVRREGATMAEVTPKALELLGLTEDATQEDIEKAVEALNESKTVTLEVQESIITPDFETAHPEIARRMREDAARLESLERKDRENAAKLFATQYEQFSSDQGLTGFGFSGLALGQVEAFHLKIADGIVTHDDLKELLDNVASGNAVVNYKEQGSSRDNAKLSDMEVTNGHEAANKLRDLALKKQVEEGMSYGDALSAVMKENEGIAKMYRESVAGEAEREGL